MHFVLSWDISVDGSQRTQIEERLKGVIQPYSWVRPLTTFYIIQVQSQRDWDQIFKGLQEAGLGKPVNFVMSPLMTGGRYNGLLSQDLWEEINKRTF